MGGSKTISGSTKEQFNDLWTIQIEINCKLTNKKENVYKLKELLYTLIQWINTLK